MYADGYLVLCGANANGHYWKQFLSGEFDRRKLIVLDAATGEQLWARNANYMNRPAVVGSDIIAEPWAFDLRTGEPKTRPHPLTGEESEWRFSRPGHHCGVITATPNMMFFRSGFIGYYDLYRDSGTRHFAGQRLGCWINAIPGNGLVMIPEASAGCVCLFSIASTVVLEPKTTNTSWGILSAVGPTTPVKRIGVNFGAPGDRKDAAGHEWFGYPRPSSRERLEFVFDLQPQLAPGGGWYSQNLQSTEIEGADTPWLYSSGARGLTRFEVPLLDADQPPATYTVNLYFADTSATPPSATTSSGAVPADAAPADKATDSLDGPAFDIRLQGQTFAEGFNPRRAAGGSHKPCVQSFSGIRVEENLLVELVPASPGRQTSIAAIEVVRE
jgi:hypothetical protein